MKFALTVLILVLFSEAAEARYLLDAQGRWVKCAADDRVCQIVPPSTVSSQQGPTVIHPQPAPPPHERMK